MSTHSIVKTSPVSKHIAMEMNLLENDTSFESEIVIEGQGINPKAIGKNFKGGKKVKLPFDVTAYGKNFGAIISPDDNLDIIQLTEDFDVATLLSLQANDILYSKYHTDDCALLDVKAGSVFAVNDVNGIKVYCSKGSSIGDSEVEFVLMPAYIQKPINYLLIRAFRYQFECLNGKNYDGYYLQLM